MICASAPQGRADSGVWEVSKSLVFVSHAAEDGAVADDLCAALGERGLNSWIAHRDVPVGADHAHEAFLALTNCDVVVVILSSAAYESPFVRREAELAVSLRTPVYPVIIDPRMQGPRSGWAHYEFSRPYGWEFLLQGFQVLYTSSVSNAGEEITSRLVLGVEHDRDR